MPASWCSPPFRAASGRDQEGLRAQAQRNDELWDVPYLPIDPKDLGRITRR
jgi:2-isopropylmalate synthase